MSSHMQFDNSTFDSFYKSREQQQAWDLNSNPWGFGHEQDCYVRSDMSSHMEMLRFLASQCDTVLELGSREAFSTAAFIAGAKKKVISVDIKATRHTHDLLKLRAEGQLPCEWEFHERSSIDPNFDYGPVDMSFYDTVHAYRHLRVELDLHARNTKKWMVFHDTWTDRDVSLDAGGEGIYRCITEMCNTGEWKIAFEVRYNHGLTVLERVV